MQDARAWAEIDLAAFRHNLELLRRAIGPSVGVAAVVKADAYGHGAVGVGREALEAGCAMLAVGDVEEARELRESGLGGAVLLLGPLLAGEEEAAVRLGLTPTVQSADEIVRLAGAARRRGARVGVHLKVDTGMHRLGANPSEAPALAAEVASAPELTLEGIYTHLSSAGMPDEAFTAAQLASFQGVLDRLEAAGLQPPLVHAANSAAAFRFPAARRGMVRSGIALYGVDPGVFARLGVALRPMLSLRARVVALRTIEPGEAVGYDQRFRAPRRTRVAVVPVGYHDGYSYRLGNRGRILVGGRSAPVIGSVTMDYLMADVTDLPGAAVGDVATLIGRDGEQELSVEELARIVGTIPYELTCRIGPRVPRRFVGGRREPGTAAA